MRLQVVVDEAELRHMKRVARRQGMSLAEWVRQAGRNAVRQQPTGSVEKKLAAIRLAARYEFPAPDIEQMLAEIERGYPTE